MGLIELARISIDRHEGDEHKVYPCPAGKLSIGRGRNLEDKGITQAESDYLLDNDIKECIEDLATFSWWNMLHEKQQVALIDLRHNLGPNRFRGFKMMIKALEMGDYTEASYQVLHSKYADQVGRRADDIAEGLL